MCLCVATHRERRGDAKRVKFDGEVGPARLWEDHPHQGARVRTGQQLDGGVELSGTQEGLWGDLKDIVKVTHRDHRTLPARVVGHPSW